MVQYKPRLRAERQPHVNEILRDGIEYPARLQLQVDNAVSTAPDFHGIAGIPIGYASLAKHGMLIQDAVFLFVRKREQTFLDRRERLVLGLDKRRQNLAGTDQARSEEHTSELQSLRHLVCRLLLEK